MTYAVGFSGGSGIAYGIRLVEVLLAAGHEVHLSATNAALRVLRHEMGVELTGAGQLDRLFDEAMRSSLHVHDIAAVESAPASSRDASNLAPSASHP